MTDAMKIGFKTICNDRKLEILDCGVGVGIVGNSIKNVFGDDVDIYGVEIHAAYINDENLKAILKDKYGLFHECYKDIEIDDMRFMLRKLPSKSVDYVVFGDSLEHIPEPDIIPTLSDAMRVSRFGVFVNAPIVVMPQGAVYDNEYETHHVHYDRKKWESLGSKCLGESENHRVAMFYFGNMVV
jgi:ubiquinone/menaquinone biosynthesis C-methylase UbiE